MNEHNTTVFINLDRPRELKLTHSVLKRVAARTKMPMSRIDEILDRYDYLGILVYEMLQRDDPTLTEEKVDELLDRISIMEMAHAAAAAFQAAFNGGDEDGTAADGKKEADDPFAGTGT